MRLTCIIVDDEVSARLGMKAMLEDFPDLELIGSCANGVDAIDQITSLKPDLIFLDVQMPDINGFEVLSSLQKPWPEVIFATAYDQFALGAFEVNAVDYLLKPFSDERFAEAIARAKEKIKSNSSDKLDKLIKQAKAKGSGSSLIDEKSQERLVIKVDGSVHMINFGDIHYIEAFDYYVKIHVGNRFFLIRETMKKMEGKLPSSSFIRTHKSYITNLSHLVALHKLSNSEYALELKDGTRLKVSRSSRTKLMERLGN
ncbi:MAG: response regulator transcription factor [Cyclobacteriaceae bacterium]